MSLSDEVTMIISTCDKFSDLWDVHFQLLEKNPELININGSGKKSPLHFAVINNCPKIVEYLVKNGAKINQSDKYSRTP